MEYPIAFLTRFNCLLEKHETDISHDGTPRYVMNPNSPNNTYSLKTCMRDYTPIYDVNLVKHFK